MVLGESKSRNHPYALLAQACFIVYQYGSFFFSARLIIVLMFNAEYYELLFDGIVV
jgi:hypothetical protein